MDYGIVKSVMGNPTLFITHFQTNYEIQTIVVTQLIRIWVMLTAHVAYCEAQVHPTLRDNVWTGDSVFAEFECTDMHDSHPPLYVAVGYFSHLYLVLVVYGSIYVT